MPVAPQIVVERVTVSQEWDSWGDSYKETVLEEALNTLVQKYSGARLVSVILVNGSSIFKDRDAVYQVILEVPQQPETPMQGMERVAEHLIT